MVIGKNVCVFYADLNFSEKIGLFIEMTIILFLRYQISTNFVIYQDYIKIPWFNLDKECK